jgi:hypothetical protein
MKVRKTTFDQEQEEKFQHWISLSGAERWEIHQEMLKRIYGDARIPLKGQKVRKIDPEKYNENG